MSTRPKRLPRLWCALQGLLPLESCLVAQRGELGWPKNLPPPIPEKTGPLPALAERPARRKM